MRVKVDFGRVAPGLLIFLIGLALFFAWLVLAIISFFFFFIPALQGIFYIALYLLFASLVIMVAGGLIILSGTSWWPGPEGQGWFSGVVARRLSKDRLRASERTGEIIGVFIALLVAFFLYENLLRGVAFYTADFGQLEKLLFFGPLLSGAFISFLRAFYGRRNALRPLDALQALFMATAAVWFLNVFPFDFSHFPDLFPGSIRFALTWVTNDIIRVLLVIAGIAGLANAVYTSVLYSAIRSRMAADRRSAL